MWSRKRGSGCGLQIRAMADTRGRPCPDDCRRTAAHEVLGVPLVRDHRVLLEPMCAAASVAPPAGRRGVLRWPSRVIFGTICAVSTCKNKINKGGNQNRTHRDVALLPQSVPRFAAPHVGVTIPSQDPRLHACRRVRLLPRNANSSARCMRRSPRPAQAQAARLRLCQSGRVGPAHVPRDLRTDPRSMPSRTLAMQRHASGLKPA